jgi:hypothetical protein
MEGESSQSGRREEGIDKDFKLVENPKYAEAKNALKIKKQKPQAREKPKFPVRHTRVPTADTMERQKRAAQLRALERNEDNFFNVSWNSGLSSIKIKELIALISFFLIGLKISTMVSEGVFSGMTPNDLSKDDIDYDVSGEN